jgi:hypothetical protein
MNKYSVKKSIVNKVVFFVCQARKDFIRYNQTLIQLTHLHIKNDILILNCIK